MCSSVKWTVRRSSLKLCARFLVCGRQSRSATSAFLTKGYGTPFIDAVCEILHGPKVPHPSSLLLNEYRVLNRAESPLDAA